MNPTPKQFGNYSNRDLYLVSLSDSNALQRIELPGSRYFFLLIVWHSAGADVDELFHIAETALKSGCVYVCTFGKGCESLHDILDETVVAWETIPEDRPIDTGNWDENHIMTTWHDDELLEDAIWFFLNNTFVDEGLTKDCRAGVVLAIGASPEEEMKIRSALTQPEEFSAEWVESTEN
ncbi:MAG: hypothetical protein J5I65_09810 [Aridibacter famidurans]|nr:hypothetical protein [Aridibacter famidurans]